MADIQCRHCQQPGDAPELLPYAAKNGAGKYIHVWLHPSCSAAWHAKYQEWCQNETRSAQG